jgi:hypothetical protein
MIPRKRDILAIVLHFILVHVFLVLIMKIMMLIDDNI